MLTITPNADPYWLDLNRERAAETLAEKIPDHYADATATHPAVLAWMQALADEAKAPAGNPIVKTGPSLAILGSVGTGKTFQAYGAVRELALSGLQLRWEFATAADLYAQLRPSAQNHGEATYRRYAHAALLVLDDVGAAKTSEWVEEINYRLINHRYERHMPTIITTNLAPRELVNGLGERVASRIVEMCTRVVLDGPDRRRSR